MDRDYGQDVRLGSGVPSVYTHAAVDQLFRLPGSVRRDLAIDAWFEHQAGELGPIARHWFEVVRACGDDVREMMHDGHPTGCVTDAAFVYVDAFSAHVNVGFFRATELPDPARLLEGSGKYMRHVKLRPDGDVDGEALEALIHIAYRDMRGRLGVE